jgi:bifunctional DNA-binding transcriptional regulator/antitoxin component of YhaV-PrlF toxin-antitoxin module
MRKKIDLESAVLGERGQVTIPKRMLDEHGMAPKSAVIIESTINGALVMPAVTVDVREFSDRQIEEFIRANDITEAEREDTLKKWRK